MAWSSVSRHSRGYGWAWEQLRQVILARDKHLCQQHKREGKVAGGTHVDHIVPKALGGTDDHDNLQVLCKACHDAKTAAESGRPIKRRVRIGGDGWPVH